MKPTRLSDACIPGVAVFGTLCSLSFTPVLCAVRYGNTREVFQVFVTQLALDAQTHRRAVWDGKLAAVHAVGQQGLRVPGISHVEAIPPSIDAIKEDVLRLGLNPDRIQHEGKRHTGPLRNRRPTLLADVFCDLRARRIASEFREGKFGRTR